MVEQKQSLHEIMALPREEIITWFKAHPKLVDEPSECKGELCPIHYAVERDDIELVRGLISISSESIAYSDSYGDTSIDYAMSSENLEMIKLLLDNCGDRSLERLIYPEEWINNPFLWDAIYDHPNLNKLKLMVRAHARYFGNRDDLLEYLGDEYRGGTIFHMIASAAQWSNMIEIMKWFLQLGVDNFDGTNWHHQRVSYHTSWYKNRLGSAEYRCCELFTVCNDSIEEWKILNLTEERIYQARQEIYFDRSLTGILLQELFLFYD